MPNMSCLHRTVGAKYIIEQFINFLKVSEFQPKRYICSKNIPT